MKKVTSNIKLVAITALLATSACQGQGGYYDNKQTYQGAGLGAIVGAAAGALSGKGSTDRRQKAMVGAGIGAVAGGGYGAYMDNQEAQLRKSLAGKGVKINRIGDQLLLTMPSSITFDSSSSTLNSQFIYTLGDVADALNAYEKTTIRVTGHTDSTGDANYNQTLSEDRANAVANALRRNGVQGSRLYVVGEGERNPVASNNTESGKAANRRVEVEISPAQQKNLFNM